LSIPLLPRAKAVLYKYRDSSNCRLLPVCSNQRFNGYLKEIGDLCGIDKDLTSHLGRHTFATTITLSKGVPIETVSRLLGHTSLVTTQIYEKVIDRKVADDMQFLM
jgi:site-specific recombinase XerD